MAAASSERAERRARQEHQRAVKALHAAAQQTCGAGDAPAGAGLALLLIVRHGETDWNVEHRLQGSAVPGPGLNAAGCVQAATLATWLRARQQASAGGQGDEELLPALLLRPLTAIYTSDLARAEQTAAALAAALPGVPVHPTHALRERCLGVLQGLTRDEARTAQPAAWQALLADDDDDDGNESGGETAAASGVSGGGWAGGVEPIAHLRARAAAEVARIAARHAGEAVALVSHGGCITSLLVHAAAAGGRGGGGGSGGASPPRTGVRNASVHLVAVGHARKQPPAPCGNGNSGRALWVLLGSTGPEGGDGTERIGGGGGSLFGGGLEGG